MVNSFFPFKTCEKPNIDGIIAQHVSATINIITCIILLYYALIAKTTTIRLLMISFILFQAYHAYSHIKHIDGHIQSNVIHVIWYFVSFMILIASIKITKHPPHQYTIILLSIIIFIDIYLSLFTDKLYMIFTGFSLPIIITLSYYNLYPDYMKKNIPYLILLLVIVVILILNEKINCENMISFAIFPYHAFIEILGLVLFSSSANIFIKSETFI
jgi:hypothetical protein